MSAGARYQLTRTASRDIERVADYLVDEAGEEVAERVVGRVYAALELLATQPGMGHRREDLTDADVRFWPVYSLLVVYREGDPLTVIRVWDARQDPVSLGALLDEPAD